MNEQAFGHSERQQSDLQEDRSQWIGALSRASKSISAQEQALISAEIENLHQSYQRISGEALGCASPEHHLAFSIAVDIVLERLGSDASYELLALKQQLDDEAGTGFARVPAISPNAPAFPNPTAVQMGWGAMVNRGTRQQL